MKEREWEIIKRCAACGEFESVPAGFIIDSPWMPGYCGVSTLDFYTDMQLWLDCYDRVKRDFPDAVFLPDYWVEFGMASEPSSFGCKMQFYADQPVMINHLIDSADDIELLDGLEIPDPQHDGLMPLALNYYRRIKSPLHDRGEKIKIVASRGPLNIATFLMGVSEFCIAVKTDPDNVHKLLQKTTELVKRWIAAQMEALDYVEGILVLDDICGFLGRDDYEEFAQPYLRQIFDGFSVPVKMFHNDNFGNKYTTFPYIKELGVNIFNFSHLADITEARRLLGESVCIMGNVPTLDVLTNGTPAQCRAETLKCLDAYGRKSGLLLSGGGGISPGMSRENGRAMMDALAEWNAAHKS